MSRSYRFRRLPRPKGVKQATQYTQSRLGDVEDRFREEISEQFECSFSEAYDIAREYARAKMTVQNSWQLNYLGYGARFTRGARKWHRVNGNRRWRHHDSQLCRELKKVAVADDARMVERGGGEFHFITGTHPLLEREFMRKHTAWDNWSLT